MTSKKRAPAKRRSKSSKAVTPRAKKASTLPKKTTKQVATKAKKKSGRAPTGVEKGTHAPDFTLASDRGGDVTLSALRGKKVVLYFYPKDDTPGCTIQACDFRDSQPTFDGLDAVVLGVSADSVASHVKFREKFALNFPLLADVDHAVSLAYGVWKEKSLYGRTFMGIERSTFLIDEDGVVIEAWRKVSPKGHADMLAEVITRV